LLAITSLHPERTNFRAHEYTGDVGIALHVTGTLLAVSAMTRQRAMAFVHPVTMSVSHLVRKPCDCLPNSGPKKSRAVLLRDDTDICPTGHVLVLISPLRFSASQTAILAFFRKAKSKKIDERHSMSWY